VYNDKRQPTLVAEQFAEMLSYSKVLPERLPDFYRYLLDYPSSKPRNVDERFYWARVKFGLKPTLRVVQMLTLHGSARDRLAYAIAEKQLYASHYFETGVGLVVLCACSRYRRSAWFLPHHADGLRTGGI
jgi:hypothetical protein